LLVISTIFERWFLQKISGSEQQGFFSLGVYVGAIPLVITGAFTPLLLRQYTIQSSSRVKLKYLFQKYSTLFFVISTIPSCFFALNSNFLINLLGGKLFLGATFVVSILCLAPIHQTYGQLTGSLMMATGKTKEYSKINILSIFIGIILTFILLSPHKYFGLNMGANGLAFKLFILQIFSVNLQVVFVCKFLKIRINFE
jgi:O-antigen/teichoic acid export membrane protein